MCTKYKSKSYHFFRVVWTSTRHQRLRSKIASEYVTKFQLLSIDFEAEACVVRLCLHTISVGLNPKTSMVLTEEVVSEVSLPDDSVKQSSHFYMHGSRFLSVACLVFPFLLASAVLACMWRSR